ncbi:MAG: DUF4340 domain-containing protein [Gemmatimonadaceae bacterium]|nr:DUF4340 domain-containing protein [Gemmatimonadaceae bacterium]
MTTKTLVRLGAVLLAALILWGALALGRRPESDRGGRLALPKIDTTTVDTVALTKGSDTAVLARTPRGTWTVNGHPASPMLVHSLLTALTDTSAWSELVAEQPSSYARLGVNADSARRVRVQARGRTMLDLTVGNHTSDYSGVFVRRTDGRPVYALHGGLGDAVSHDAADWRDKRIATVAPESVTTVEVQRGKARYTLQRNGTTWTLGSAGAADSAAVASLLDAYHDLVATSIATPAQADSAHFTHPTRHARLMGKGGAPLASLAFDSTANAVWVRADTGGTVYRIDHWMLDRLTPAESTLRAKPKR